jgi:hypothetical protein
MTTALDIRKLHLPSGPSEWDAVDAETINSLRTTDGIMNPAQWATLQGIWGRRWFLIRADTGLCSRCTRCHQMHKYLTLGCVPIPYNGITEVFGMLEQQYGRDTAMSIIALGDVVPITRTDARKLYGQIRAKGYEL